MCQNVLRDARFWELLLQIDRDLAEEVRVGGCPRCGGPLHRADFGRKPRGGPDASSWSFARRIDLCCGRSGCRRRSLPPSVRFLGRKIHLAAMVVLACVVTNGPTEKRAQRLGRTLGIDRRTLSRWCCWWSEELPRTPFWKEARSRFMPVPSGRDLPTKLLVCFGGPEPESLLRLLRFLSPLGTAVGWSHAS